MSVSEECHNECPLCASHSAVQLDALAVKDLTHEYRRQWGISVESELGHLLAPLRLIKCCNCGLERFEPLLVGSELFYRQLSESPAYYERDRWEFGRVKALISQKERVLDVGCGDGAFLSMINCDFKQGIDLNREAVIKARYRGLNVQHQSLDSLPHSAFDTITLFQVLEHVTDPIGLLRSLFERLAPGGRLIISVPNNDGFMGDVAYEPLNAPPHHPLRWTEAALRHIPQLLPVRLAALETEPLSKQHQFAYRRTVLMRKLRKITGLGLSRMAQTPTALGLRKLATVITLTISRFNRPSTITKNIGHSYLVTYSKLGRAAAARLHCQ